MSLTNRSCFSTWALKKGCFLQFNFGTRVSRMLDLPSIMYQLKLKMVSSFSFKGTRKTDTLSKESMELARNGALPGLMRMSKHLESTFIWLRVSQI